MVTSRLYVFVAALASLFVAGCTTTASDGRYQTGGGSGWSNFRAEALPLPSTSLS